MEKIKLTDAEWKIISLLWEREPMTIAEITAALLNETGWGRNTVITLLDRMEKKGAVLCERDGVKTYRALYSREDASLPETQSFLKRIYNGSLGLMVNSLIEQDALSEEDIAELYGILKKAEGKKK